MNAGHVVGLITGVLFGFLLQKGRVLRFDKQVGAMLLKDMTIFKFMLSAIVVGMVGILLLSDAGVITLNHKALNLGGVLLGGLLFGIGWAVMGFCPGTAIGALGEGALACPLRHRGHDSRRGALCGMLSLPQHDRTRLERPGQDCAPRDTRHLALDRGSHFRGRHGGHVRVV